MKKWYKTFISRKNRKNVKQLLQEGDQEQIDLFKDKPLDPWAVD